MKKRRSTVKRFTQRPRGIVSVEYILLLTVVGIGLVVGLGAVRSGLIVAMKSLAHAIKAIVS